MLRTGYETCSLLALNRYYAYYLGIANNGATVQQLAEVHEELYYINIEHIRRVSN